MPAHRHLQGTNHIAEWLEPRRLLAADVVVDGSNSISFDDDQTLGSLTLLDTARATVLAGSPKILRAGALSIASDARLDLNNNDLLIDYESSSPFITLRDYTLGDPRIVASISDGSQVLALFDNALLGATAWRERPIDMSTVIGHFTWVGDVNLDDQVTGDDYTIIDSNLNTTPLAGLAWLSGDANRDGLVTGDDYTVIDSNLHNGELPGALRINAGGPALLDSLARPFDADAGFTGGQVGNFSGDVLNTVDDALFNSFRSGASFMLSRAVPNGNYTLLLEFAEPVHTAAGQRTFDVFAEGNQVLDDFDVFAAAGAFQHAAVARSFNIHVSDRRLDVGFIGVTDDAIVSAVVLVPNDAPPAAQVYSGEYQADSVKLVRAASQLRSIGQAILLYSNENRGRFPPDLLTLLRTQDIGYETFAGPRTGTLTPRGELIALEREAFVAALDDFVYRGAGMNNSAPPEAVVAYENPSRVAGELNALMGDGSVRTFDRQTLAAILGTTFPEAPPAPPLPPPAIPLDARIVQSQSNLRQMSQAFSNYLNTNKGHYPATFGEVANFSSIDAAAFVNPRTDSPPPPTPMTQSEKVAWINAGTDYRYLGAGQRSSARGDTVIVYENPQTISDGINILFADGSVRFVELPWAQQILARAGVAI